MTYKKLTLAIALTFIIAIAYQVLASYMTSPEGLKYPNPGHYPGEIGPGTFNASGNPNPYWKFPGKLISTDFINSTKGFCIGGNCITSWPSGGGISGSGTTNYIPKWTGSTSLGNSVIYQSGSNIGIGTTSPSAKLDVNGSAKIGGNLDMSGNKITNVAAPIASSDAATKGYVDAQVGGGAGGMGLQGNIVFHDISSNYGISTVPLSLPKANCNVKITVCDYGNNPPTKLIIGADPVPRITKPRNDVSPEERAGKLSFMVGDTRVYIKHICCPYKYKPGEVTFWGDFGCNPNVFRYGDDVGCMKKDHDIDCGSWSMKCPSDHPYGDCEDGVCYAEPRCPSAEAGEVFIQEDDVDNVCVYCPSDHPIYDATTKHCIRAASADTVKVGNCATLSTVLESAFTDVTFADADGNPLSTADYVAVAYSCPSQ